MTETRPLTLSRLENLSDGVFGFSMTLLVLGLGVDEAYRLLEAGDVREGLAQMLPRFGTMLLGLFGIGAFWVAHNVQFRHVEVPDRNLLFLNLLCMFFIIVLPFSIALWGRRWEDPRVILILISNLALYNASAWAQWRYIVRMRARGDAPIPARVRSRATRAYLLPNLPWAVVVVLAFLHPLSGVVLFVGTTFAYAIPGISRWMWRAR